MQYPHRFQGMVTELAALSSHPLTATNPPILCLHGWLDNAASFIPLAQQLPELPLLALEFPGHGHSQHRGIDANYYFFDWVQDVVALCQRQNWQQLTIIGHSMGAMVATALAASFPELVARLILIDGLGFITAAPEHAAKQLRDGITSRLKPVSRKPHYNSISEAAAARQKQSDFSLTEALLLAERGTMATSTGWTWRTDMRLRQQSVSRLTPEQASALVSAVTCPVLAFLATDSAFVEQLSAMSAHYQTLQCENIKAGHHCHMTHADVLAEPIRRFLQQ
jgi:pimeloyl-ACP methyl ester carboxylesterase